MHKVQEQQPEVSPVLRIHVSSKKKEVTSPLATSWALLLLCHYYQNQSYCREGAGVTLLTNVDSLQERQVEKHLICDSYEGFGD